MPSMAFRFSIGITAIDVGVLTHHHGRDGTRNRDGDGGLIGRCCVQASTLLSAFLRHSGPFFLLNDHGRCRPRKPLCPKHRADLGPVAG